MRLAAVVDYFPDKAKIEATWPQRRQYMRDFLDSGRLLAAGPFAEDLGAVIVFEADSLDEAEEWLQGNPYHAAGVYERWRIHPFKHWSAQGAGHGKGKVAD